MAKKINPEEMKRHTIKLEEAKALEEECSFGVGSPIEVRIAAALLEYGNNMKSQQKSADRLCNKVQACLDESKRAGAKLEDNFRELKSASKQLSMASKSLTASSDAVLNMQAEIVRNTMQAIEAQLFPRCNSAVIESVNKSLALSEEVERKAETHLERADKYSAEFEERVRKSANQLHNLALNRFMPTTHKIALVAFAIMIALCAFICSNIVTTFGPIMTGEVTIGYSDSYKNSLTEAEHELAVTQAELDAYKAAFPEGLTEGRQAALDEKVSQLQQAESNS